MKEYRSQLHWIHANGNRRYEPRTAGGLMHGVAETVTAAQSHRQKVEQVLDEIVDQEFHEGCSSWHRSGDAVVVRVASAALVYVMRIRWSDRLLKALRKADVQPRIRRIAFEFGND